MSKLQPLVALGGRLKCKQGSMTRWKGKKLALKDAKANAHDAKTDRRLLIPLSLDPPQAPNPTIFQAEGQAKGRLGAAQTFAPRLPSSMSVRGVKVNVEILAPRLGPFHAVSLRNIHLLLCPLQPIGSFLRFA